MNPMQWVVAGAVALFFAMLACLEAGYRAGRRGLVPLPEAAQEGVDIEAAILALLGLLLAFSFAGGMSRLDARRQMIVQEANAISTAYSRLDLLSPDDQPQMRRLFRDYLDTRLEAYGNVSEEENSAAAARVAELQQEIWTRAVTASRTDPSLKVSLLLLPSINEMTDLTTVRMIEERTHLPGLILALMIIVAMLSALLSGYTMSKRKSRSWFLAIVFSGVIAITLYVVIDLDYPRSGGFIGLKSADQALRQLRDTMR